jgi:hypothetical protein
MPKICIICDSEITRSETVYYEIEVPPEWCNVERKVICTECIELLENNLHKIEKTKSKNKRKLTGIQKKSKKARNDDSEIGDKNPESEYQNCKIQTFCFNNRTVKHK